MSRLSQNAAAAGLTLWRLDFTNGRPVVRTTPEARELQAIAANYGKRRE
jgi:hypothetical protein